MYDKCYAVHKGHTLNKLGKGPQDDDTYEMSRF